MRLFMGLLATLVLVAGCAKSSSDKKGGGDNPPLGKLTEQQKAEAVGLFLAAIRVESVVSPEKSEPSDEFAREMMEMTAGCANEYQATQSNPVEETHIVDGAGCPISYASRMVAHIQGNENRVKVNGKGTITYAVKDNQAYNELNDIYGFNFDARLKADIKATSSNSATVKMAKTAQGKMKSYLLGDLNAYRNEFIDVTAQEDGKAFGTIALVRGTEIKGTWAEVKIKITMNGDSVKTEAFLNDEPLEGLGLMNSMEFDEVLRSADRAKIQTLKALNR